mmetsp:Transcript_22388/g.29027  ORF Transcript_22388/g.29027 Transcript_22388/m.29027 type:complete len:276 (+) Transcript_22388:174-1001(+)
MSQREKQISTSKKQKKLNHELNIAALQENLALVEEKLEAGADPNWRNPAENQYLNTALHMAAFKGNALIVERLLAAGANPEIENKFHNKPMIFAAYYGRDDAVRVLLNSGADVTAYCRKNGLTALHKACMQGHLSTAKLLIANGHYPLSLDKKDRTPADVIGVEGEAKIEDGVKEELIRLLETEGRRVISAGHPEHELAFSVVSMSSALCSRCAWYLEKGSPVFRCPQCQPEFYLCQKCIKTEMHESADSINGMNGNNSSPWLLNFFQCNFECFR